MSEFTDFTVEEPPRSNRGPGSARDYEAIAVAVRKLSGQWIKLSETVGTGQAAFFQKKLGAGFEITTRRAPGDGKRYHLYLRFVPEESS